MVLSKQSWYSKVYFFIQSWWSFSRGNEWQGDRWAKGSGKGTGTDICTFGRAFLLKFPFLIMCHITYISLICFTLIIFPIHYLGATGYFTAGLVICGIVGLGFGVRYGRKQLHSYLNAKPSKPARTTPTFLEICCAWIKSHHDNICVLMTFENEESEDEKSD